MIYSLAIAIVVLLCRLDVLTPWLTKEVAEWAVAEFEEQEGLRSKMSWKGTDRRAASPFISGDGFRTYCEHICEDANRCRMDPEKVKDGECVFVKTDFFKFFVEEVAPRIPGRYIIVSHNGDLSAPDGQSDAKKIGMPNYIVSDKLDSEYRKGRLIAHHGQNIWWANITFGAPRPEWTHCLPIGFENRQYRVGGNVKVYAQVLRSNVLNRTVLDVAARAKLPLLLIAFYPKSRVPDRTKVLNILGVYKKPKPENPFYNFTDLSHLEWLHAIREHRFVLSPFGHGLDTHRVSEILLMGGIPVMRRSTISSCFDDSDNRIVNASTGKVERRGPLPVVILDKWEDLTKERLESEWERLSKIPDSHWDWRRLFIYHWADRIKNSQSPYSLAVK